MVSAVHIRGLAELDKAFAAASRTEQKELRVGLAEAAEPVGRSAESLARERISHIGDAWSEMRIGVTRRLVYVAQKQRGRESRRNPNLRRPNLAELLLGRSMVPALELHAGEVQERLGHVLDTVGRVWEAV